MEEWPIDTMVGIGPIRFGMTAQEVSEALSSPASESGGSTWFLNNGARVTIENEHVVEISVTPLSKRNVTYKGMTVFGWEPFPLLDSLERDGGEMFEQDGYLMVPKLGLMFTGVHDGDRAQLAVTALPETFDPHEFGEAPQVTAASLVQ